MGDGFHFPPCIISNFWHLRPHLHGCHPWHHPILLRTSLVPPKLQLSVLGLRLLPAAPSEWLALRFPLPRSDKKRRGGHRVFYPSDPTVPLSAASDPLTLMKITALLVLQCAGADGDSSSGLLDAVVLANASDVSRFGYFQRSAAKEFILFVGRTVAKRTSPGQRQSVQHEGLFSD